MRLTVVGCSGSYPGPESPASCYLVEHDGFRVVLDLGNGSLGVLQRYADLESIDAVVLSHLHADHCLDLCSLYVHKRYQPGGPGRRIPVFGPAGTPQRLARAYDLPEEPGMHGEFDFVEISPGTTGLGPFTVTAARVNHPVEAYGFRVTAGHRTIAYSGDTAECEALLELVRDADVALIEASCVDGREVPNVHLSARQAGQVAARAGVRHLVATHLVPWNDRAVTLEQARTAFDGELTLAATGLTIDL
ncbi:MAG: MBL fold metallo-hydrolase [Candidatus Nanopelagicales bacterium]